MYPSFPLVKLAKKHGGVSLQLYKLVHVIIVQVFQY